MSPAVVRVRNAGERASGRVLTPPLFPDFRLRHTTASATMLNTRIETRTEFVAKWTT